MVGSCSSSSLSPHARFCFCSVLFCFFFFCSVLDSFLPACLHLSTRASFFFYLCLIAAWHSCGPILCLLPGSWALCIMRPRRPAYSRACLRHILVLRLALPPISWACFCLYNNPPPLQMRCLFRRYLQARLSFNVYRTMPSLDALRRPWYALMAAASSGTQKEAGAGRAGGGRWRGRWRVPWRLEGGMYDFVYRRTRAHLTR